MIKTIGDEVMVVGPDPAALAGWALRLGGLMPEEPRPRAAVHYGYAQYREGDYFGREVNLAVARAGRVGPRRGAGHAAGRRGERVPSCASSRLAEVHLRGFSEPTELFRVLDGTARVSVVETILDASGPRGCSRPAAPSS